MYERINITVYERNNITVNERINITVYERINITVNERINITVNEVPLQVAVSFLFASLCDSVCEIWFLFLFKSDWLSSVQSS